MGESEADSGPDERVGNDLEQNADATEQVDAANEPDDATNESDDITEEQADPTEEKDASSYREHILNPENHSIPDSMPFDLPFPEHTEIQVVTESSAYDLVRFITNSEFEELRDLYVSYIEGHPEYGELILTMDTTSNTGEEYPSFAYEVDYGGENTLHVAVRIDIHNEEQREVVLTMF